MRAIVGATVLLASLMYGPLSFAGSTDNDQSLVAQGKYIATEGDCAACHTAPDGGADLAGGYAITSPLGNIMSSNITPSKQFGIGSYTEAEFARALRRGIDKSGRNLYPAMPYAAYARMTDQDVKALYAYLMTAVPPVDKPAPTTNLPFPFDIRQSMIFWNLLFAPEPLPALTGAAGSAETAQIARGEYLVNALEHCADCHTPRNIAMGLSGGQAFAGGSLGTWYAPNITPDETSGIGSWSQADIAQYLKTGDLPGKAQAAGPMAEAVEHSLQHLSDSDIQAIAVYLKQLKPIATGTQSRFQAMAAISDEDILRGQKVVSGQPIGAPDEAAILYSGNCAACHTPSGRGDYNQFYPALPGNSALDTERPDNLVATILNGVTRSVNGQTIVMPAFGPDAYVNRLSYAQVAELTNYLLATYGHGSAKLTAADVQTIAQGGPKPAIYYLGTYAIYAAVAVLVVIIAIGLWLVSRRKQKGSRKP